MNECNQLREVVRQFEDTGVLTQQTTENGATKLPLDNIRSHHVQAPTTLFRRVLDSRLKLPSTCKKQHSGSKGTGEPGVLRRRGRKERGRRIGALGTQKRRYHGSLGLHSVKRKRWTFRKPPALSCHSRSTVSSTTPQVVQETPELFQGEHVPTCRRDSCTRKCVKANESGKLTAAGYCSFARQDHTRCMRLSGASLHLGQRPSSAKRATTKPIFDHCPAQSREGPDWRCMRLYSACRHIA